MANFTQKLIGQSVPMPTPKPAIPDAQAAILPMADGGQIPVPSAKPSVAVAGRPPVPEGRANALNIPIPTTGGMDADAFGQAYAQKAYQPTDSKLGALAQGMNNARIGRKMFETEQAERTKASEAAAEQAAWERGMKEREFALEQQKADAASAPKPLSLIAKINRDFENGLISEAQRNQAVANTNKQQSGFSLEVGPDGKVSVVQGPSVGGGEKMTEQQSKDTVYATRAAGSLPVLDQYGNELTNWLTREATDVAPDWSNFIKSEKYQQAEQAGREFLQAILRKDTGAAITDGEMDSYGKTYLPFPGDKPPVLAQKQAARQRALMALQFGLPPQSILKMERAGLDLAPTVVEETDGDASPTPGGANSATPDFSQMSDEQLRAIIDGE